jgi:hypothetical protein
MLARAAIIAVMLLPACSVQCWGPAEARAESGRVEAAQALAVLCPGRVSLAPAFERAARKHHVPASLLVAQSRNESNCDPEAIGRKDERGLLQLKPGTRAAGNVPLDRLHVPAVNASLGAAHLARCLLLCGDWAGALGVFAGHRTCAQGRASRYARNVIGYWNEVKGERRS